MSQAVPDHQRAGCSWARAGISRVVLLFAISAMTGCARPSLYDWGSYEDSLYLRYADQDFSQAESYLSQSIPRTAHPSRAPPGVYADYGFLLYRRGDYAGALQYFEKEKKAFPESSALMTKLSDRVQQKMDEKSSPKDVDPDPAPAVP
ncbi:MAG: DUF4810 domain-containing protein [Methylococcales bacterium]